jgi:hypothetical protein
MLKTAGTINLTASDLVGHLNCHYLTHLDLAVANDVLAKPKVSVFSVSGARFHDEPISNQHIYRLIALCGCNV